MDTLALLCNLHADGPATLQLLRQEGCGSLRSLLRLDALGLATLLDWSEEDAGRFLREADLLARRLGEPAHAPPAPAPEPVAHEEAPVEEPVAEEEEAPALYVETRSYESVQEVLGAWRELDSVDPPLAPDESRTTASADEDPELRDYVVEPAAALANRPLSRVDLPGLDEALVLRLAQLGIHSLGGLVEAPTTALARRLPMPFTRLHRLQFLARRELAREGAGAAGRPASAGPFA